MSVVNIGNAPLLPRHLHLVNCFQEGMLEFDGPMDSVSADFRPLHREVGGEGKKRKKGAG